MSACLCLPCCGEGTQESWWDPAGDSLCILGAHHLPPALLPMKRLWFLPPATVGSPRSCPPPPACRGCTSITQELPNAATAWKSTGTFPRGHALQVSDAGRDSPSGRGGWTIPSSSSSSKLRLEMKLFPLAVLQALKCGTPSASRRPEQRRS